jgi:hypothetical protein
MDAPLFDRLVRRLATRNLSRRAALRASAGGLAAAALAAAQGAAAQGTPSAGGGAEAENNASLFVQTAAAGSFVPNPQAAMAATPGASGTPTAARHGAYRLTLTGHTGETIAFADRPARTFSEVPTSRFIQSQGGMFTPLNPPNAALVADTPQQEDDVLLLELLNPRYDAGTQTLTYEADILQQYQGEGLKPLAAKQQDRSIAPRFGPASLFIDDCPDGVVYCHVPNGSVVGDLGSQGYCWHWDVWRCEPCNGGWDHTAALCNQTFPACQNACYTDPSLNA